MFLLKFIESMLKTRSYTEKNHLDISKNKIYFLCTFKLITLLVRFLNVYLNWKEILKTIDLFVCESPVSMNF